MLTTRYAVEYSKGLVIDDYIQFERPGSSYYQLSIDRDKLRTNEVWTVRSANPKLHDRVFDEGVKLWAFLLGSGA